MKNLLKIILIGIIAAATYKYLNEKDISVSQQVEQFKSSLEKLIQQASSYVDAYNPERESEKRHVLEKPNETTTTPTKKAAPRPAQEAPLSSALFFLPKT